MRMASRRAAGFLSALPSYLGGKRKLLGRIFKTMPQPVDASVLVDPFLGGGSVSLMAKARGYAIRCSDVAVRSVLVGRALIANDRVTLSHEDLVQLFATEPEPPPGFVEQNFGGDVLPVHHARFLDRALPCVRMREDAKGALLGLLLLRYVMALRPLGNFGAKTVVRQMGRGDWDDVNPSVLRDSFTGRFQAHPITICEELRRRINRGVFANGHENSVRQADVFEFLADVEGDAVYLDPPYGGTVAYESALRPLDTILEGRMVDAAPSAFSGRHGVEMLDRLLAACRRFPHLVLSYGNAAAKPDEVEALVAKHRMDVHMEVLAHVHLAAVASDATKAKNREILISAGAAR